MGIVAQPAYEILPSYRPVKFFVEFGAGTLVIENAVVEIFKGGVSIGDKIRFKSSSNSGAAFPGLVMYYFEIDIQKYCQDLLEPFEELPSIFVSAATATAVNTKFFDIFYIEIVYEYIDPATGLLLPVAFLDTSNDFYIYTAARQHQDNVQMWLLDYTGTLYGADTNRLSSSPNPKKVCTSDNEYISIIQDNLLAISGIRITFYDTNGAFLGYGQAATGAPFGSAQFTINVGLSGLANLTYTDGAFPAGVVGSYEIQFGYVTSPTTMAIQTETYYYEVQGDCCPEKTLRLHWMNTLGGADSFTFKYDKDLLLKTQSDIGEKSLNWSIGSPTPHTISDIGKMKLKSQGATFYSVNSGILTNEVANWLSGILVSPKVYAEIDGNFVPVTVGNTTQSISRRKGKITLPLIVDLSNDMIIPRL